ncbi:MAG TPA: cytochrome c oxidase assembly protein, partial [Gemmatimonadaceae bacterium]|nr:cytochrome c oxidase assembly protein [Gemmatimonadaceae bacterium]
MNWWCSARGTAWTWEWQAYPGVWLFILLLAFGVWRWNRAGARAAGRPAPPLHPAFVAGLFLLWLALDWPIGALGAGYLASVHMLQFLLMALAAPPLLLRGPSPDALTLLERDTFAARLVRRLTAPRNALILFSAVVLLTHLPPIVDALMVTQAGSMLIDLLWIGAGLCFWWPVVLRVPAHGRFPPPVQIGYIVLGLMFSPIMFGLVGFLVYSDTPLYGVFELAPPLPGVRARDDHQLAGVMM